MTRVAAYAMLTLALIIALIFTDPKSPASALIGGFLAGIAVPLLDTFLANLRYSRIALYVIRMRSKRVRLSVSYLYRIPLGDEFMLVKSRRFDHYGPVGGVYKAHSAGLVRLRELRALSDDLIPLDQKSQDDLRLRMPGWNLIRFIRWFESEFGREIGPWREFQEELIEPGILPSSTFPFNSAQFLRREVRPLRYSLYAGAYELLIADIFELILDEKQLRQLRALKEQGHPDIVWAKEDQIRRLGAMPGQPNQVRIGEPAIWTL